MKNILIKNKFFYYFYKRIKILKNSSKNFHLGEFGEDIFVRRFLKSFKNGFYVDVGCYHPVKGSLTNYLFNSGWKGMNIDLSQVSIDLFNISRPKDINVRAAVSNFNGETKYFENGLINQQNSINKNKKNTINIRAFTLNALLEKFNINKIDFLNIDTEGHDFKVISDFNFNKYDPSLICIEQNSYDLNEIIKSDIHICLVANKFFLASRYGVTSIYVNNKYIKTIDSMMSV